MSPNTMWVIGVGWIITSLVFAWLWRIQQKRQDAGLVDVAWSAGIGLLILFYALFVGTDSFRRIFVPLLACNWSFRLAIYLHKRMQGKPEDGRYAELRRKWGAEASRKMFAFFQFQAFTVVLLSIPAFIALTNPKGLLDGWDYASAIVLLMSVIGERNADNQLNRFRSDPANKGKTCRQGLWRYSRHPNYFFEWLHWWTYPLLSVGSPHLWITFLAPLLMLYVLTKLTGIPATESHALVTRADYADYQKSTSAFFPWFPRRSPHDEVVDRAG